MAKKKFGKFVALATVSGFIAAGISYFLKYKSFHDELEEDFHDFEGEDEEFDGKLPHASETAERIYVSLNDKKDDIVEAVKEKGEAIADTLEEKADKVEDAVESIASEVSDKAKDIVKETADAVKDIAEDISTTIEEDSMD